MDKIQSSFPKKAIVQTPTPNLDQSLKFYFKLGFKLLREDPFLMSDGKSVLEINPDRTARSGIKIYSSSWKKEVDLLKEITFVQDLDGGFVLADPSGTWIYLIESDFPYTFNFEDISKSVIGNYAGVSLESMDFTKSTTIFETLGFIRTSGNVDHGYVGYSLNGFELAIMKPLMCPHLFFNPSLNYFNGKDNLAVIQKIRDLEIPITEEITHFNKDGLVDNIIIRDPGGFGFFIFSD